MLFFSVELVRQSELERGYQNLKQSLMKHVLEIIAPMFEKYMKAGDEEEVCRKAALVLCEMVEGYMCTIADGSPMGLSVLQALLMASSHPSKSIASNTFYAWYQVSLFLSGIESDYREDDDRGPQGGKQNGHDASSAQHPKILPFVPFFQRLLPAVIEVMKLPSNYEQMASDDQDDCKRLRHTSADCLLDITNVLGTRAVLQQICSKLQPAYNMFRSNPAHWQGLEAHLHCIRALGRRVSAAENEFIPSVMMMVCTLPLDVPYLRYTGTLLVGRYCEWINAHPDTLPNLLNFVCQGFTHPEVVRSACLSFRHLCDECADRLLHAAYFDNLFQICKDSNQLPDLEPQKDVIEGFCLVMSALQPEQVESCMLNLVHPMAGGLHGSLTRKDVDGMGKWLDRVAQVFRSVEPRRCSDRDAVRKAVAKVTAELWPLFEQVIRDYIHDDRVIEKLCRCWKYSMKMAGASFSPMLQPYLETIANYYTVVPRSAFIYGLSTVVDTFRGQPEYQAIMHHCLHAISVKTFNILTTAESFTENPDIVEDFFELGMRCLNCMPESMLESELVVKMFVCGLQGLLVQHREAYSSLLAFFETIVKSDHESFKVHTRVFHCRAAALLPSWPIRPPTTITSNIHAMVL